MGLSPRIFALDSFHTYGSKRTSLSLLAKDLGYRYVFYLRQCQAGGIRKLLFAIPRKHLSNHCGIEIGPCVKCGGGLYLGHPWAITVNGNATLGTNVNLSKGCTIGAENRGQRKGVPTLGNCVFVGVNATVVGGVSIGDDVLIAPGAYVNQDVPAHSIAVGNPCRIIPRENATEGYIVRRDSGY